MSVERIGAASPITQILSESPVRKAGDGFLDLLKQAGQEAVKHQLEADKEVAALVTGSGDNLHDVTIAMQKAELSLKLAVQVRNKVIEAYNEIMRMQV